MCRYSLTNRFEMWLVEIFYFIIELYKRHLDLGMVASAITKETNV